MIEHIAGDKNVWADMLTRWAVKPHAKVSAGKLARLMLAPIKLIGASGLNPSLNEEYDWPTRECVSKRKRVSSLKAPRGFNKRAGIYQDGRNVF